jgi:hypothetical protein
MTLRELPFDEVQKRRVAIAAVVSCTFATAIAALICFVDYLYSSGPTTPDPATGQVIRILMKHREFFVRDWEYALAIYAPLGFAVLGTLWHTVCRLVLGAWPSIPVRFSLTLFGVCVVFMLACGAIYNFP